jgi:hypothetical protein
VTAKKRGRETQAHNKLSVVGGENNYCFHHPSFGRKAIARVQITSTAWVHHIRSQVVHHHGTPIAFGGQDKEVRLVHDYQQGTQRDKPRSPLGISCRPAGRLIPFGWPSGIDILQGNVGIDLPSRRNGGHEFLEGSGILGGQVLDIGISS